MASRTTLHRLHTRNKDRSKYHRSQLPDSFRVNWVAQLDRLHRSLLSREAKDRDAQLAGIGGITPRHSTCNAAARSLIASGCRPTRTDHLVTTALADFATRIQGHQRQFLQIFKASLDATQQNRETFPESVSLIRKAKERTGSLIGARPEQSPAASRLRNIVIAAVRSQSIIFVCIGHQQKLRTPSCSTKSNTRLQSPKYPVGQPIQPLLSVAFQRCPAVLRLHTHP